MHAMVLVGHRKDDVNGDLFLLQNWWEKMPFIEVDAKYLASVDAYLTFIVTIQPQIPEKFETNDAAYVELDMDIGEQYEPEMN